jgi:hypothetical protein
MEEVKTIKNVDEETWRDFKVLAAKSNLKMALLLKIMIKEFEKKSEESWNKILKSGKNLSREESEGMMKVTEKLRKERGFRE